jgi:hypothetical protein
MNEMEDEDPTDWVKHWAAEFATAEKALGKWHKQGSKVVKKFLDERTDNQDDWGLVESRLNLFHANVTTLMAMLYGNTPKVEVDRTFSDSTDDVARVAAEMISRMLAQDIQAPGSDQLTTLRNVLQDRLLPGLGTARVAYNYSSKTEVTEAIIDAEGKELAPEVTEEKITDEWVDILYLHWRDVLWSPSRTYAEIRWRAFRSYLTKKQARERFGEDMAKQLTFSSKGPVNTEKGANNKSEAINQAEVWEIWDKTTFSVFWYSKGCPKILDQIEDPLELDQFFPDPPPMVANVTTTKWIPRADYMLSQDLYDEVDKLQTRISYLTDACKLIGVYDKTQEGVKRIFQEGVENDLIPVDNWAMFGEKGGLKGVIDWVPLDAVVNTIEILTTKQSEKIQQLYEVTGMSDIMRGASQPYESATASKAKVQYASIRVQCLQDEFARFASDLQSLKMEIIQKHFQPYCILQQSNIQNTPDAPLAEQAVALLKDRSKSAWRIKIRPESLAMADYAQIKADRMEYIMGLSQFMQSSAPLLQVSPDIAPTLLKMLQWGMAGFKGSQEIEGVLDSAIEQATKAAANPPPPKPDPAIEKAKMDMQKTQMEMQQSKEEHQANMQMQQQKFQMESQQSQDEFKLKMAEMQQKFELEMTQLRMEMDAKVKEQQAEFAYNTAERRDEAAINQQERTHAAAVSMVSDREKAKADSRNAGGDTD